jgi:hypothetical protein
MWSKPSERLEAKWREIVAGYPVSGQTIVSVRRKFQLPTILTVF